MLHTLNILFCTYVEVILRTTWNICIKTRTSKIDRNITLLLFFIFDYKLFQKGLIVSLKRLKKDFIWVSWPIFYIINFVINLYLYSMLRSNDWRYSLAMKFVLDGVE